MNPNRAPKLTPNSGSALLGVLILAALGTMILAGTLGMLSASVAATKNKANRTRDYYEVERSFNMALSWLRAHSDYLISPFLRDQFYENFDRVSPMVGANDNSLFNVPAKLLRKNSKDTPLLLNDPVLGQASFPITFAAATTSKFDPVLAFAAADLGTALIRITLVDALAQSPGSDYGDPKQGALPPRTDFYPVFRIDALSDLSAGAHLFGYVIGSLVFSDYGFFGRDAVELRSNCDAYDSLAGAYSTSNRNPACGVASWGTVSIAKQQYVYGSAAAKKGLTLGGLWEKNVCATFAANCPVPGAICEGSHCAIPPLAAADPWSSLCPQHQGNLNVNKSTPLEIGGSNPRDRCWNRVTIARNQTLTLVTTTIPYYFAELVFQNDAKLLVQPQVSGETVSLFVNTMGSNRVSGIQLDNSANRPHQFKLNYLGSNTLTLRDSPNMFAVLEAPNAGISIGPNLEFFGSIRAQRLVVSNNCPLHYDEAAGAASPSDLRFSLKNMIQRYR